jgi:hypothetical protein
VTPAQQRLTLIATDPRLGPVVFLDGTVVNVALPAISEGLDVGLAGQQWVVEAYTLAPRGAAAGRRQPRRPVRPPPDLRDRADRLRRDLGALRDPRPPTRS